MQDMDGTWTGNGRDMDRKWTGNGQEMGKNWNAHFALFLFLLPFDSSFSFVKAVVQLANFYSFFRFDASSFD